MAMHWPMLRPFGRRSELATRGDDPFSALRREMDRLFEGFGRDLGWSSGDLPVGALAPSIDVTESDTELRIEAEMPGVDEKDVEVTLTDNVLTVRGEKKAEREEKKKDYHLVERSYGSYARSVTLPFAAEADKAKASFKNGVLTITLPKPPEIAAKAKKIAIGAAKG
jgi:HSP20 family protein